MKRFSKILLVSLLLVVLVVGLLPQVAMAQTTIDSSIGSQAYFDSPSSRKSFFANGNQWVFYQDATNLCYRYSTDGETGAAWSAEQIIRAATHGGGIGFSVYFDGTYGYYFTSHDPGATVYLYFRRFTPLANGTLDFGGVAEQTISTYGDQYTDIAGSADTNGYPWVIYSYPSNNNYYVEKSSTNDGTWIDAWAPYQVSNTEGAYGSGAELFALTNGKMLAMYDNGGSGTQRLRVRRYDGANWGSIATWTTQALLPTGVAQDDNVHFVFKDGSHNLKYVLYQYSTNGFSGEVTIQATVTSTSAPAISRDTTNNDLWVFWENYPTDDHMYLAMYDSSAVAWSSTQDMFTEIDGLPTTGSYLNAHYAAARDELGIFFIAGTAILKFKYLGDQFHVDTLTATGVTETQATLRGEIVSISWGSPIERGIYWDTVPSLGNATGTLELWSETDPGGYSVGIFSHTASGFTEGEDYYCMAYAVNAETAYGEWVEFNPGGTEGWAVLTLAPDPVGDFEATFWGNITEISGTYATVKGFEWGYTATPTWSWEATGNFTVGTYSHEITTLEADSIYYMRAYAGNATAHDHGQWIGFITQQPSYSDEDNPPGDDTGLTPPIPSEPGGWIRPPKDWGNIGLPGAQIPLTFFVWILLTGFIVLVGFGITKFTRSLAVLFMVLGFILGIFSFWPKGGYLDWWIMLPYFLVGWALLSRQKDSPISE